MLLRKTTHLSLLRFFLLLCFSYTFFQNATATNKSSIKITPKVVTDIPPQLLKLRLNNDSISKNDLLNEEVVDLINVSERDTMVPTWYQTHQGGGFGWFIRMIGFWWQAVDRHRYKLVGTSKSMPSLPDKDELTEHDINYDVLPHQQKYIDLMWYGISSQIKRKKARKHNLTKPPYIQPTDSTLERYRVHCELTPPKHLRKQLTTKFYPCLPGLNVDQHPNICDPNPTIGVYGPYVLDCNHSCHPEIHPYEWIWWLDHNVRGGINPDPKNWVVGFMKESSDRFELWTLPPRVGFISIPFLFKTSEVHSYLKVTHLVTGHFSPLGLPRVKKRLPAQTNDFNFTETTIDVPVTLGKSFPLTIKTDRPLPTKYLRWWLSDVSTDVTGNWIWGYFNMVVSVSNAYTARVEYVPQQ